MKGNKQFNAPKKRKSKEKKPLRGSRPHEHVDKKPLHPEALKAKKARSRKKLNKVQCTVRLEFPKARIAKLLGVPHVDERILRKLIGFDTFDETEDTVGFEQIHYVKKGTSADQWILSHEQEISQIQTDINALLNLNDEYEGPDEEISEDEASWTLTVKLDESVNTPEALNILSMQTDSANGLMKILDSWRQTNENPAEDK